MPLGLTPLLEGTETLAPLAEGSEVLTALSELIVSIRLGFFPDTALYSAPYSFPGSTSYPGDTIVVGLADFAPLAEGVETLTPLAEGTETLTPLLED